MRCQSVSSGRVARAWQAARPPAARRGAQAAAELLRALECGEAPADEDPVPPVLGDLDAMPEAASMSFWGGRQRHADATSG